MCIVFAVATLFYLVLTLGSGRYGSHGHHGPGGSGRLVLGYHVVMMAAMVVMGVMMLPIPARGMLRAVSGIDDARAVPGIVDLTISIPIGDEVVPLPEGNRYLGFIFARGGSPDAVETSLRAAHRRLRFEIEPAYAAPFAGL